MRIDQDNPENAAGQEQKALTERIALWVDSLTPAQAIWRAIAVLALLAVVHFCAVSYLTGHWPWEVLSPGSVPLAHLGAYGDSMAPWTAGFALLAALFAGLAFREQRDALNMERANAKDERNQSNLTRFDGLFVQAIDMYDNAFAMLDQAAKRSKKATSGQSLLRSLRKRRLRGDIPAGDPVVARNYWTALLRQIKYQPVQRFASTVFALIQWLDDVVGATGLREHPSTERWIRLFVSRMSGVERYMLMELIEFTAPQDVKDSERRLKIFDWERLERYTKPHPSVKDDTRFKHVPRTSVEIASQLQDLVDLLRGKPLEPQEVARPMIVRRHRDRFILVSGVASYLSRLADAVLPVLMLSDASEHEFGGKEADQLSRKGSKLPFDDELVKWVGMRFSLQGSVQSVWIMSVDAEKDWFVRDDPLSFLVFVPAGSDPTIWTNEKRSETVRVRVREEGKDQISEHGSDPREFAPLGWRQMTDCYAEYSEPLRNGGSIRGRAWRCYPSPFGQQPDNSSQN